jgi:hypothetical protein
VKAVSHLSRRFRVRFDDTRVVPYAGLVVPLRLGDRFGLRHRIDQATPGRDRGGRPNGGDKASSVVAMLLAGGEFINDVGILNAGATLARLGYQRFSGSRLGEWLRSFTPRDVAALNDALTDVTAAAWAAGFGPDLSAVSVTDPVVVDLDSTHTETYGIAKDGATVRNYGGRRGYHPLLAVEASTGQVIAAELRAGNASPANRAGGFCADALDRVDHLSGGARIPLLVRADSGFYTWGLIDTCIRRRVRFSITVRQFSRVKDTIAGIDDTQWRPIHHTPKERIDITAVPYTITGATADNRTPIRCRLIVRRTTIPADTGGPQPRLFDLVDHHAFVTDQPGDPATLWQRHKDRAVIEATIRDLKHGLALNHFPSGSFTANAAWLALNALTHNLARWTNQLLTPHPLTTKTLRYRYLTIPGRITTGSRRTTLHLPTNWPWQHHITTALTHLHAA